jgi:DNA processing protein
MTRDDLEAWLRLLESPQLGRESARKLLAAFGSPQAVIGASTAARREVVPLPRASALATPPDTLAPLIELTLQWLGQATAAVPRAVIPLDDPRFPRALLDSADPPLLLYAQGRMELLQADAIAIVGSRNPTPQGAENARAFALHLSTAGLTVVSGLALGIDAAAHAGGLDGRASTIAVVGTGLDIVYPRRNLALAHRVAAHGLMLSEYALGTPSLAPNFPQRNRIIAGLARGTLVVEAALKSGSLITARMANESGREVFAIPGSIHSPQSRGCHALIKQGAKLVETAQDLLDELRWPVANEHRGAVNGPASAMAAADPLLEALGFDPVTLDALAARTGQAAADLSARLLALELEGCVARLPGQLFQRLQRP